MGEAFHVGLSGMVYVVVEPHPVLRMDLAETLEFGDRHAAVIAESTVEAALTLLKSVAFIKVALVAAAPADFEGSPLATVIRQKGGRVVLMGHEAETQGEGLGYSVLHRPFSQAQVLALLTHQVKAPCPVGGDLG